MFDAIASMVEINLLSLVILAFTTSGVCMVEMSTIKCGTVNFTRELIWNGIRADRGEWPFLTALFKINEEEENKFFCGGTLISSMHVLTGTVECNFDTGELRPYFTRGLMVWHAAHCIIDKGGSNKRLPSDINVLLGAYNLTSKTETGVQQRSVQEIHVHPEWNVFSDKYDADLAILLLNESVLFTDYIRPVCIPADDTAIDDVRGSVVGWGLTEIGTKPNTEFIKRAFVTALNSVYCLTEDHGAAVISSPRTFCGRGDNGNANRGDSGGGFYVENQESAWVQRGIVSALRTNSSGYINADSVVIYTNVPNFKNWILDIVSNSEATVGEAKTNVKLNLECRFQYGSVNNKYTCYLDNLNIRSDNIAVESFSGTHLRRKTDQDVEQILFRNRRIFFIPSGIGQIFNNVKRMQIGDLGIKRIQRSNFESLQGLVDFRILKNEITLLDRDSLRDLQQLEVFIIVEGRLSEIEEGTFEMNINLKEVWLYGNRLEALPRHIFRNNLLLELVTLSDNFLKTIDESIFETNIKLNDVSLHGNRLNVLPKQLFQNNLLLQIVDLGDNSLSIIDRSIFATNINLKQIYLYGNELNILPKQLFQNNSLLEVVNLGDNYLEIIDESTFGTNIKLKKVFLYGNKIEVLPRHLFQNNSFLEVVDLNKNFLRIIDIDFTTLKSIKEIYFYNNTCIDAFDKGDHIEDLRPFLNLIRTNCSSPSP